MPTLEITTTVGCPLTCTFCPQNTLRGAYGRNEERVLRVENFKAILDKIPPYVRIDFSGFSEPWANPHCTPMLRHTLERGYSVAIYTTLVGLYPNEGAVIDLLTAHTAQVEVLCLHLPDVHGNMRGYKPGPLYERALDSFIKAGASCARRFEMMTMDSEGRVHPSIKNIARLPEWNALSRAGTLNKDVVGEQPVEETPQHSTPVGCSMTPFYDHNVLLPNGDVVLCCMDYQTKHKIGNLLTGDYWSLFASEGMNALRCENQNLGHSDKSLCKSCSRARRYDVAPDNRQTWVIQ